jgi:hypothetical protein
MPAPSPGVEAVTTGMSARMHGSAMPSAGRAFDLANVPVSREPSVLYRSGLDEARANASRRRNGIDPDAESAVVRSATEPGTPLPEALRTQLEVAFGTGLSGVQIHTGAASEDAARAVSARAFAYGQDIHFGAGQYDPASHGGLELLAHEVAHTVQSQRAGHRGSEDAGHLEVSSPTGAAEQEAANVAQGIATSMTPRAHAKAWQSPTHPRIHRAVDRAKLEANRISLELEAVIGSATWKEIRKRVYPKASAGGIRRAQERHAGLRVDLSGVGRLATLDRFATKVRGIQAKWPQLTPDRRVGELGGVANSELTAADVPGFLALSKQPMDSKGFFNPGGWEFAISQELVVGTSLGNDDAAQVAMVTLHESRHAEQQFLAARFSAGREKKSAAALVTEQNIPLTIAQKAVAKKFDAKTDPVAAGLGERMFQAMVTDQKANSESVGKDERPELNKRRFTAQIALAALQRSSTREDMTRAKEAKDALVKQITAVEQWYERYRSLPEEADAHEVGDAAEQAFRGWPGAPSPGSAKDDLLR